MADDALDFPQIYVKTLQRLGIVYGDDEFLYPHDPPWPQDMFDYPYGMAPPIDEIPADEQRDWEREVGNYYLGIALGLDKSPTTNGLVGFLENNLAANGLRGYADIPDALFLSLLTEGLYSKYLSLLDPRDNDLFGVNPNDGYQYLKADFSCMRVVQPREDEFVAPTIAVVRRKTATPTVYELYKVAIAPQGGDVWDKKVVRLFQPPDTSNAWRMAKYFVLQGAISRINLIDHVRVHFAHEAINGVTKAVLPKWHLLQQLLLPHFWLTLPVNYAVLEGPRSLINRDTWYPWSPFAAKGDQIRKLLPFSWAGNQYYFDDPNQSYPAYKFSRDPKAVIDGRTGQLIPTFIGLNVSEYARFQLDYWKPIRDFVAAVLQTLPDPPTNPASHNDQVWLEIQHWAYEIGKFIPGFTTWMDICDRNKLTDTVTMVIWNAAIVHSADHGTLHTMISDPKKPVPFILRVTPDQGTKKLGKVIGEAGRKVLYDLLLPIKIWFVTGPMIDKALVEIDLEPEQIPLCLPTDVVWAQMADLLFYLPHNSSLLCEVKYPFTSDNDGLKAAQAKFNDDLAGVDGKWFGGGVKGPATDYGFPRLTAPPGEPDPKAFKMTRCIGAGIQY